MKMKTFKTPVYLVLIIFSALFTACEDQNAIEVPADNDVDLFFDAVNADPVYLDGIRFGDSWRLVRETASYFDDPWQKEFDYDLLTDPEHMNYREYWVFDKDKVLIKTSGERFEKNWDGYYEIFDYRLDEKNYDVSIDYVYDDGEKQKHYTRLWMIMMISDHELVLREEHPGSDDFYQYTFRREKY